MLREADVALVCVGDFGWRVVLVLDCTFVVARPDSVFYLPFFGWAVGDGFQGVSPIFPLVHRVSVLFCVQVVQVSQGFGAGDVVEGRGGNFLFVQLCFVPCIGQTVEFIGVNFESFPNS